MQWKGKTEQRITLPSHFRGSGFRNLGFRGLGFSSSEGELITSFLVLGVAGDSTKSTPKGTTLAKAAQDASEAFLG